jgi:hypothetical protein
VWLKSFFNQLSRIQSEMIKDGKATLITGEEIDLNSAGGLLAVNIYMETLESAKEAMVGLARLGYKTENKVWDKLQ